MQKNTYGLVGFPLGHSFSKGYFTDFFRKEGICAEYKNFELARIDDLAKVLECYELPVWHADDRQSQASALVQELPQRTVFYNRQWTKLEKQRP